MTAQVDPKVLERLHRCSRRMFQAVQRAMHLDAAFQVLNEPGDRRKVLARSPGSPAIATIEDAILKQLVITLARVFDRPNAQRLSFPVAVELLNKPGVLDHYARDARSWPAQSADASEAEVRRLSGILAARMQSLDDETPNRLKLLRDYRNTNIAHELFHEVPRDNPQFRQIWSMVPEAVASAEELMMIVQGASVAWAPQQVTKASTWLWETAAAAVQGAEGRG